MAPEIYLMYCYYLDADNKIFGKTMIKVSSRVLLKFIMMKKKYTIEDNNE